MKYVDVLKTDPVWGEFLNSLLTMVIGVFLLLPFSTFRLQVYSTLGSVMHEMAWGGLFTAVGLLNWASLAWASPRWRRRLALAMTFLWLLMAVSFIISLPAGLLAPIAVCLAINSGVIFFQIGNLYYKKSC